MAVTNTTHLFGATSDDVCRRVAIQQDIAQRVDQCRQDTDTMLLDRLQLWARTLVVCDEPLLALLDICSFAQALVERQARRDADKDPA